jgi:site-specific recombinase XerC
MAGIHNRMPVILDEKDWSKWLVRHLFLHRASAAKHRRASKRLDARHGLRWSCRRTRSVSLFKQASFARRAALLETIYASGMRVREAVSLPARAARTKVPHLLIRGKGDKERIVLLHAKALEAMQRWRRLAAEYGTNCTNSGVWLFRGLQL